MKNHKGKSKDATGSDATESFEDECLDSKVVGTLQKYLERSYRAR